MEREVKFRFRLLSKYDKAKDIEYYTLDELSRGYYPDDNWWKILSKDEYTGLRDVTGKEIYEGDIVKCEDVGIGVVRWDSNLAYFYIAVKLLDYNLGEDFEISVYSKQQEGCNINREVIGNIYDNPGLLKD